MEERKIANERYKPGKRYNSPLGSLVWCGNCGAKYAWRLNGYNQDGSVRAYYTCYSRNKADKKLVRDPNCKSKNYRDKKLEEIIYNEIRKLKTDSAYFDELRTSIDNTDIIRVIANKIEELEEQMSKLMDLYSVGGININLISEKVEALSEEKEKLEEELYQLELEKSVVEKETVLGLVDLFEKALASGDTIAIRDVVAEIIDYIEIDGEDIRIHWNF
jgi:site-specific DNA recombinase